MEASKQKKKISSAIGSIGNGVQNFWKFVLESFGELRYVTWLSANETIKYSAYVLALTVGVALLFALADFLFFEAFVALTNI